MTKQLTTQQALLQLENWCHDKSYIFCELITSYGNMCTDGKLCYIGKIYEDFIVLYDENINPLITFSPKLDFYSIENDGLEIHGYNCETNIEIVISIIE